MIATPSPQRQPIRVQMSRQRPWRAEHPDAVIVARPSRWGNPYAVVKEFHTWGVRPPGYACIEPATASLTQAEAIEHAIRYFQQHAQAVADDIRSELAGHDLACWCPLGQPCHADVLLEIANGGAE